LLGSKIGCLDIRFLLLSSILISISHPNCQFPLLVFPALLTPPRFPCPPHSLSFSPPSSLSSSHYVRGPPLLILSLHLLPRSFSSPHSSLQPPTSHTQGLSSSMAKLHQGVLIGTPAKTCCQSLSMSTIAQSTFERSSPASESKNITPSKPRSPPSLLFSSYCKCAHAHATSQIFQPRKQLH